MRWNRPCATRAGCPVRVEEILFSRLISWFPSKEQYRQQHNNQDRCNKGKEWDVVKLLRKPHPAEHYS